MAAILHVEDLSELALVVGEELSKKYEVSHVADLKTAEQLLKSRHFDLILLDVGLPDGSGFDFYEQVLAFNCKDIPVIFLTGQGEQESRVRGLELGAQDYILKPFYTRELILRIEMRLKQFQNQSSDFRLADLKFEKNRHQVSLIKNDAAESLNLTPNEYKILAFLAENSNRAISRDKIVENVWGAGISISDKAVSSHISNLRKKIQHSSCQISSDKSGYLLKVI